MACAINSLPVPVSPWIRTAQSVGATVPTSSSTARKLELDPIKSEIGIILSLPACHCAQLRRLVQYLGTGLTPMIYAALLLKPIGVLTCSSRLGLPLRPRLHNAAGRFLSCGAEKSLRSEFEVRIASSAGHQSEREDS